MNTLIQTQNLSLHYSQLSPLLRRPIHTVHAVNNIGLTITKGESLGLVGESGCGKSSLGKTLIRYSQPTSGHIYYSHNNTPVDIASIPIRQLKKAGIRHKLQMLLQDHASAMNPRMSIKQIIGEAITARPEKPKDNRQHIILKCLQQVGLNETHLNRYPHEFSGGQRQRICIARTLAMQPEFIVLDEPTSALDVSVQAQILILLNDIRKQLGLTYVFITHNLLILKYVCTRVAVMYLGSIVEIIDVFDLFAHARHPYTKSLLNCVPDIDKDDSLAPIAGEIPDVSKKQMGCGFCTRCPHATQECASIPPELKQISKNHWISCHKEGDLGLGATPKSP
ncbi:MAG: peptide/nickel transport system ATP-binding protein [Candidatus Magnetoglobus multicellularis str. Araruama]|uniref:Peptide/nickel transport system ATP-binding protein n=1 Tax=Candidatus Magnetoglobus multicellularis str. Araruama TaxID=890399 RepID=A0A1V1PAS9_9BACT|nr:MAG: peptide/nickel transport system ATP-binding protein [Candidatus Magnetoglobus multicellularis str. Araruama]